MYAVMFYVILNKRKLHFPLAKNVMHSPSIEDVDVDEDGPPEHLWSNIAPSTEESRAQSSPWPKVLNN